MLLINKQKNQVVTKAGASDHIIRHQCPPSKNRRKQRESIKTLVMLDKLSPWRVIQRLSLKKVATNFQDAHHQHYTYKILGIAIWSCMPSLKYHFDCNHKLGTFPTVSLILFHNSLQSQFKYHLPLHYLPSSHFQSKVLFLSMFFNLFILQHTIVTCDAIYARCPPQSSLIFSLSS